MFKFIFFNVYEIFVATAGVLIVGVIIFALIYRAKQDAKNQASGQGDITSADQNALREVSLSSSGVAPVRNQDAKAPD